MADLVALVLLRGDLVIPGRQVTICRDPEDNMVIEAALAREAPWVVNGDEDLLSLGMHETVSFVTPCASFQRLDEEWSGTNADAAPDNGEAV